MEIRNNGIKLSITRNKELVDKLKNLIYKKLDKTKKRNDDLNKAFKKLVADSKKPSGKRLIKNIS